MTDSKINFPTGNMNQNVLDGLWEKLQNIAFKVFKREGER
jgi:hypothetical protein